MTSYAILALSLILLSIIATFFSVAAIYTGFRLNMQKHNAEAWQSKVGLALISLVPILLAIHFTVSVFYIVSSYPGDNLEREDSTTLTSTMKTPDNGNFTVQVTLTPEKAPSSKKKAKDK